MSFDVLAAILALPALDDLTLALDSSVVSPGAFGQAAAGSRLSVLDLMASPFREDWLHPLAGLTTLQRLSLRGYEGAWFDGRPVASSLKTLATLKALTFLSVTPAPTLLLHIDAFPRLDSLTELHLRGLVYCMADIAGCQGLQAVCFGPDGQIGTNWTDSRPAVALGNRPSTFELLARLPKLRSLMIRTFWAPDHEDLAPLAALNHLEEITLGGEGRVETAVAQLRACNHLKRVFLEGLETPAEVLEHFASFKALEELRLVRCSAIHGNSLVGVIGSMSSLRKLVLIGCSPDGEVAVVKSGLAKSQNLNLRVE